MTDDLFDNIVSITEEYLGPAAKRFISRQIIFHLDKDPKEIVLADIPKLAEWTRVTFALLTEDREMVDNFIGRLLRLDEAGSGIRNGS